jgi:hypothetical protein
MSAAGSNPASSATRADTVGTSDRLARARARAPTRGGGQDVSDVNRYRWSRAYGLRFLGGATIILGVLWLVSAVTGFSWWSLVLLGMGVAVLLGCLLRFVSVPPLLLEVSSHGYRLRNVRGGGVPVATWSEVESVSAGRGDEGAVMVVRLSGGRSTVVPLALLGPQAVDAERDMHERLNAAFGYRRLRDP